MDSADIKEMVRDRYGSIAAASASCCAPATSCCSPEDEKAARMGYTEAELNAVPDGANLGLGCGNPQAIAALRPGEVLIDLGSGAGFDCLLAAQAGRARGPRDRRRHDPRDAEAKARDNAARVGAANVEFRLGELEHLPVADGTGDVIISNCVINLVPDKAQVFREAFRVLKPGGRLAIADVVNVKPLPPELASDKALLCGCVAGAAPRTRSRTGCRPPASPTSRIEVKPESREYIATWAAGRGIENYVASATIEARKPAAA